MPGPHSIEISKRFIENKGKEYAERFNPRRDFGRRYQVNFYFKPYIRPDDDILDLGCADGFFLREIHCGRKIGVEVNEAALYMCRQLSQTSEGAIELFKDISHVRDSAVDVVISNHCLEHIVNPFATLNHVLRVLRPGGRLLLVTPFDDWRRSIHSTWTPDDSDNHLFTWSPRNIGNLVSEAGFIIDEVKMYRFASSARFKWILKLFGGISFRIAGQILARLQKRGEVMTKARKALILPRYSGHIEKPHVNRGVRGGCVHETEPKKI